MIIRKNTLLFNGNQPYSFEEDCYLREVKESFIEDGFTEQDYYDFIYYNYISTSVNIHYHLSVKPLEDFGLVKLEKGESYKTSTLKESLDKWNKMAEEVLTEEDFEKAEKEIYNKLNEFSLDKK